MWGMLIMCLEGILVQDVLVLTFFKKKHAIKVECSLNFHLLFYTFHLLFYSLPFLERSLVAIICV